MISLKLNLVDVEGLNWADKKRDGVIAIRVSVITQIQLNSFIANFVLTNSRL